eukprot:1564774-Rhodomonas_salina.1
MSGAGSVTLGRKPGAKRFAARTNRAGTSGRARTPLFAFQGRSCLLSRDSGALAGRKLRLSISTGGYSRTPARASTIFGRAWSDEPGTIGTANVSAYTLLDGNSATACAHIAVTRQHVTDQKQYYFWYQ